MIYIHYNYYKVIKINDVGLDIEHVPVPRPGLVLLVGRCWLAGRSLETFALSKRKFLREYGVNLHQTNATMDNTLITDVR